MKKIKDILFRIKEYFVIIKAKKLRNYINKKNILWNKIQNEIWTSELKKDWKCPECGNSLNIGFGSVKNRTSLHIKCNKCQLQSISDGDLKIPSWYKDPQPAIDALLKNVIESKEKKEWFCPLCGSNNLNIIFDKVIKTRASVEIKCLGCNTLMKNYGDFNIPPWYEDKPRKL